MPRIPGGPLATRPLHYIWIADCSGSMAQDGKIQALNTAIREALPHMRRVAEDNPYAAVLVRAVRFATGAQWHVAQPTPVAEFQWTDLQAGGVTDLGQALKLVAAELRVPPMEPRALPPVLVLFGVALAQAAAEIYQPEVLATRRTTPALTPGWAVARTAGWTAALALGVALALLAGQNHYLRRPWLSVREGLAGGVGSLTVGALAGSVGQLLFQFASHAPAAETVGRVVAWGGLGGLLAVGLTFVVPNLGRWQALLGGAVGGGLGALGFLAAAGWFSDLPGRLLGAGGLGFATGLMVAWVETVFRTAWLEVSYGPKEIRTVCLGPEPVGVGSDARRCAIYVRGAPSVALRYQIQDGRIWCEDGIRRDRCPVGPGDRRQIGSVVLVVCTRNGASDPGPDLEATVRTPPTSELIGWRLRLASGREVPLREGRPLTAADLPGLEAGRSDGVVAEVTRKPDEPRVLGLTNRSRQTWTAVMADGQRRSVAPGRTVKLAPQTRIDFGGLHGEIIT